MSPPRGQCLGARPCSAHEYSHGRTTPMSTGARNIRFQPQTKTIEDHDPTSGDQLHRRSRGDVDDRRRWSRVSTESRETVLPESTGTTVTGRRGSHLLPTARALDRRNTMLSM